MRGKSVQYIINKCFKSKIKRVNDNKVEKFVVNKFKYKLKNKKISRNIVNNELCIYFKDVLNHLNI